VRRTAALLVAAVVLGLVTGCFGPSPRGTSSRDPAVRVALGVVPRSEVPERLVPEGTNLVRCKGKRYRGILRTVNTDSGVLVVNVLPLDQYLKGVVPLELGERPTAERAALEAQVQRLEADGYRVELAEPAWPAGVREYPLLKLQQAGLAVETVEDMYRIMAIANYEDRFVIPSTHREYAENAFNVRGSCGFSFGNGCSEGTTETSLFGSEKKRTIPVKLEV